MPHHSPRLAPPLLALACGLLACTPNGAPPADGGGPTTDAARPIDRDSPDRGPADAAPLDTGPSDAGSLDAGPPDAASTDGGPPADCIDADALIAAFYADHGGPDAFAAEVRRPFEAFLRGEAAVCRGDLAGAAATLEAVWRETPPGDPAWGRLFDAGDGANLGAPVAYYGLRMLQDVIDHRGVDPGPDMSRPVRLTVLLPGCAEGIQPRTWAELQAGEGVAVRHALDPAVIADEHAIVHASLDVFGRYVRAMTRGHLRLVVDIIEQPEVCVPVFAQAEPHRLATIQSPAPAFAALEGHVVDRTDWWMVIYPSHVPEQHADFAGVEFISGGMGLHANGGPLFLADDRWFVRKPPHLGDGPYTAAERRTYLPQWLQHEFYHHLFRLYPEHALEARSHQWFDRATWPDDFQGIYEPDYYHQALHRRFRDSDPPLHARLRYAGPDPALWAALSPDAIAGRYTREPVENPWHAGRITAEGDDGWRWTNEAGVTWRLGDAIARGRLTGGPDNPYFGQAPDVDFHLVLARDADGVHRPLVQGFRFLGELYRRAE